MKKALLGLAALVLLTAGGCAHAPKTPCGPVPAGYKCVCKDHFVGYREAGLKRPGLEGGYERLYERRCDLVPAHLL